MVELERVVDLQIVTPLFVDIVRHLQNVHPRGRKVMVEDTIMIGTAKGIKLFISASLSDQESNYFSCQIKKLNFPFSLNHER